MCKFATGSLNLEGSCHGNILDGSGTGCYLPPGLVSPLPDEVDSDEERPHFQLGQAQRWSLFLMICVSVSVHHVRACLNTTLMKHNMAQPVFD